MANRVSWIGLCLLLACVVAVAVKAADKAEAEALVARLNANAAGAIWHHSGSGYFERAHRAALTEDGALEITFEQCRLWRGSFLTKALEDQMALCATGPFRWQKTRLAVPLAEADSSKTAVVRSDARSVGIGMRVVFNCNRIFFSCVERLEGPDSRIEFGILCRDWVRCRDSHDAVLRLIALAKQGAL